MNSALELVSIGGAIAGLWVWSLWIKTWEAKAAIFGWRKAAAVMGFVVAALGGYAIVQALFKAMG